MRIKIELAYKAHMIYNISLIKGGENGDTIEKKRCAGLE
jgi:hypothetical protein